MSLSTLNFNESLSIKTSVLHICVLQGGSRSDCDLGSHIIGPHSSDYTLCASRTPLSVVGAVVSDDEIHSYGSFWLKFVLSLSGL